MVKQQTYSFVGLDPSSQQLLRDILTRMSGVLQASWKQGLPDTADVVICSDDTVLEQQVPIVIRCMVDPQDESLTMIGLSRVIDSVKTAEIILGAKLTEASGPWSLWLGLAEVLKSAQQREAASLLRVTFDRGNEIWIDLRKNRYGSKEPIRKLGRITELSQIEIIDVGPGMPSVFSETNWRIEPVLWLAGLGAMPGKLAPWMQENSRYRLNCWPNFAEFPHAVNEMAIAARLASRSLSVEELTSLSRTTENEVMSVLNALGLMGQLEATEIKLAAPAPVQVEMPPEPQRKGISQLVARFRNKFGM